VFSLNLEYKIKPIALNLTFKVMKLKLIIFFWAYTYLHTSAQTHKDVPFIANQSHPNLRMRFKVVDSKVLNKRNLTASFLKKINSFEKYEYLAPLILEKSIPEIQDQLTKRTFTVHELCLFYLYRIQKYELDSNLSLNSIISLNPKLLKEAKKMDSRKKAGLLWGIPILLKDNIGFEGLPTTAGAEVLKENMAKDAFITKKLKKQGALILGKANLSEWAYFFCNGCPLGYSAVGGQTMNPYGRKKLESGGSSSGSGAAIAANLAVAAVGSETSGSILSPASLNSLFGLKPTPGVLSRSGIVPISSTLDTPGPMAKHAIDIALMMQAMQGYDASDYKSKKENKNYLEDLKIASIKNKRFAVLKNLKAQTNYQKMIELLIANGAEIIELEIPNPKIDGLRNIMVYDMPIDLKNYLKKYASKNISVKNIADIVKYNLENETLRSPYGQELLDGILNDTVSSVSHAINQTKTNKDALAYFNTIFKTHKVDFFLSINNFHAGAAAAALYPALTLPMGYLEDNQAQGLTLIAPSFHEKELVKAAVAIEKLNKIRKMPSFYK
jgi:amidase